MSSLGSACVVMALMVKTVLSLVSEIANTIAFCFLLCILYTSIACEHLNNTQKITIYIYSNITLHLPVCRAAHFHIQINIIMCTDILYARIHSFYSKCHRIPFSLTHIHFGAYNIHDSTFFNTSYSY